MIGGYLAMSRRVLFSLGGPLGIDEPRCAIARLKEASPAESTDRSTTQPQRRCVPPGSIMKLSVGRRGLNALQTEVGGGDVQPHMHRLTTSYFPSYE